MKVLRSPSLSSTEVRVAVLTWPSCSRSASGKGGLGAGS